jgi:hypothetical protein
MTETTDVVREFTDQLPRHARHQLHLTQTTTGMIHAAVRDHGWTITQLATECSRNLDGVTNMGALITYRLGHASAHPPPAPVTRTGLRVVPLCGQCVDGFELDPESLLPARRCPCRTVKETIG